MQAHMNNFFGAIAQTMRIRLEQHEALVGICRVSLHWQGAEGGAAWLVSAIRWAT